MRVKNAEAASDWERMNWTKNKNWDGQEQFVYTFDGTEPVPSYYKMAGDKVAISATTLLMGWAFPSSEENLQFVADNINKVTVVGYKAGNLLFSCLEVPVVELEFTERVNSVSLPGDFTGELASDTRNYFIEHKTEILQRSVFRDGSRGPWEPCGYKKRECKYYGKWVD